MVRASRLPPATLAVQPTREVLKPENQLELSEKDLDEEIAKMLTAVNPAAPKNIARYDQKLRQFKFEPMVDMNMVRPPSPPRPLPGLTPALCRTTHTF